MKVRNLELTISQIKFLAKIKSLGERIGSPQVKFHVLSVWVLKVLRFFVGVRRVLGLVKFTYRSSLLIGWTTTKERDAQLL
ncbi:hypothetical protein C1751_03105 [Pseudomonas fluorescens]|nr:hypothetical protein C1751_03105 [Pseudomonas fluorescens]